uniref:Serpentine receptor class gamma n=1 Tax=Parastrongyloides trichosuri TaxID=131310 RepID=A0A0N4ZAK3_PARTI
MMIETVDYIILAFEFISCIFYTIVAFYFASKITKKDKENMNSFYSAFIIGYFIDQLELAKTIVFVTIPSFGLFTEFYRDNPIPGYMIGALGYFCTFASILGSFTLSLNRLIATTFPFFYRSHYAKYCSFLNIFIQIVLPIIVFHHKFGKRDLLILDKNTQRWVYSSENAASSRYNNTVAAFFILTILIFQIVCNILNFYKLISSKNNPSPIIEYKTNVSLVIYCSVATIGTATIALRYWIKYIGTYQTDFSLKNFGQTLGTWTSVITTCSEPYLLLIVNKSMRYEFFGFLLRRKNSVNVMSSSTNNNINVNNNPANTRYKVSRVQ